MKKYILSVFIFISLFSLTGLAQWSWQYPIPQGNRLNDMLFLDGTNTGYAVGNNGIIMKSADMGLSWTLMDSATTMNLNGIAFTSQGKGYAVGNSGVILTTKQSGQWESMESGTHYHLNGVAFSTEDNGYAVGYKGLILRKSGDIWEETNSPTIHALYCINFASITTAIAAGDSGTIVRTSDGGSSWQIIDVPFERAFNDVYFQTENLGFLAGQKGLILKTTDAGLTWEDVSYQQLEDNLMSIHFYNDTSGYASGANGVIMSTIDGGENWIYHDKKTNLSFNEIIQLAPKYDTIIDTVPHTVCDTIILCGDNGVILRSDSCIDRLENVTNGSNYTLSSIRFPKKNKAYAVGGDPFLNEPFFLKSTNGKNWNAFTIDTVKKYMTAIDFIDTTIAYISAMSGKVYRFYSDGDSAWPLQTDVPDHLYAVRAFDTTLVYAAGINGTLIKTVSGDTTWQKQETNTQKHLYSLHFFNPNLGYAVGDDGIMLKIKQGGDQISKIQTGHSVPFYDIHFPTENIGFIVGYKGRILKVVRNNGNETFTQIPSGVTTPLNEIYFPNPSVGYIAGEGGVVLKTTDGGESWLPVYTGTQNGFRSLHFNDEAEGWVAGAGTSILKTENGGGAVITPGIAETKIEEYRINLYPNPATNETWIEFDLEDRSVVSISTWDLAGRQLEFIADGYQHSGTVRYKYNTAGLPEGIYLVIIDINNVRQAKKLVILK